MSRIFISYKRVDKDKVFKIKDQIESALGERCWIDLDGIESDAIFAEKIIHAIDTCKVFLFMYSSNHSKISDFQKDWTIRELQYAESEGKRIVFVNIDDTPLTSWFKFMFVNKQQVNGKSPAALSRLIADLKTWLDITDARIDHNYVDTSNPESTPPVQAANSDLTDVQQHPLSRARRIVRAIWLYLVLSVHLFTLFCTLGVMGHHIGMWFVLLLLCIGTYGTWMEIKYKKYSLYITAAGDITAALINCLFCGGWSEANVFILVMMILCIGFHSFVLTAVGQTRRLL